MDQQQQQGGQAHQPPKYDIQNGGHYGASAAVGAVLFFGPVGVVALSAQGYVPHTELYSGLWSNINQGLTGASRDILATYWQQTINHLETETHDFKIHQLPLARIKKVMKADPEVKMISAEAPILFAKGCDIFITELTMRAWIHAEDNKRRTLQRSDIAAALGKSDMFDFLIDIVPREESGAHGGAKRPTTSGGQAGFQQPAAQSAQPQAQQAQQAAMGPPDYGQIHHALPQDQQYRQPGIGYSGHLGAEGQQDPTQQYGQQMFSGQDMYNPYATGQNFGGQMYAGIGNRPQSQGYAAAASSAVMDPQLLTSSPPRPVKAEDQDRDLPATHRLLLLSAAACAWFIAVRLIHSQPSDGGGHISVHRDLVSEVPKQDHFFVSANHPRLHYNGRWIPVHHHQLKPRRDTSFVGASLEFSLANVSSAYLQLRNDNGQQKQRQADGVSMEENATALGLAILTGGGETPPSAPVSVRVEVEDQELHQGLDFNGNARRGLLIEAVTSSSPAAPGSLDSYTSLLAASFNVSHASHLHLPFCLTAPATSNATCAPGQPTIHNAYFRSGLPSTSHFLLPYHFPLPAPSAYAAFIKSIRAHGYPHDSSPLLVPVHQYEPQEIEENPASASASASAQAPPTLDPDAIWRYNSAPSTFAIVLITPFTPHKPLRRLLSHALDQVVQRVRQDHGDTSTSWLDTTGWLHSHDFGPDRNQQPDQQQLPLLTAEAHAKIAGLLATELCAYLVDPAAADACPFRNAGGASPAPYVGSLVVPEVRDIGVLLEQRKLELLRQLVTY
ncbi:hypothetical protein DV738_g932, partial [Chaetothyriales sp. CBS 135597]